MAVYIKNMKKPERCGCCRFTRAFDCQITGEFIKDHNQILDSCPLVERPTTEQSSKVGEWIAKDGVFYCSCRDNDSAGLSEDDVYVYEIPLPNYCKDCGARIKGAEE